MELTLAHYRNRFCMFRTYYALAEGLVKPEGFDLKVIEVADPPSHELEEVLIRGDVAVRQRLSAELPQAQARRRPHRGPVHGVEVHLQG